MQSIPFSMAFIPIASVRTHRLQTKSCLPIENRLPKDCHEEMQRKDRLEGLQISCLKCARGKNLIQIKFFLEIVKQFDVMDVARVLLVAWSIVQCVAGFVSAFLVWCSRDRSKPVNLPSCVLVVPLYLPNETSIVVDTLKHAATQPVDRVHIVVNTPEEMPKLEAELRDLAEALTTKSRPVEFTRVIGSTSKAANLNYAVEVATEEHTILYDADHRIDCDDCTRLRTSLAMHPEYLAVSGILGVRGKGCFTKFLDAMEWTNWVVLLSMQRVFIGTYVFGGSNAIWHTCILRQHRFDETLLLEDMDLMLRSLCANPGRRIVCNVNVRSTELGVFNLHAWWNQRMRWMMGWEQLSCRRFSLVARHRCRLCLMWMFRYAGVVAASVTVWQFVRQILLGVVSHTIHWMQWWMDWVPIFLYILLVVLWIVLLKENGRRALSILVFTASSSVILYMFVLMNIIAIFKVACSRRRPSWIVTVRANESLEKL